MLTGIDSLLTGELLWHLDAMGHGDKLLISDAHFPLLKGTPGRIALPGVPAPRAVRAVRSVFPLDEGVSAYVMDAPAVAEEVLEDLRAAANVQPGDVASLSRQEFYRRSKTVALVIRTGETRLFGNILLVKGVVSS